MVIELGDVPFDKAMTRVTSHELDVKELVAELETHYGALLCESQFRALHEAVPEDESISASLKRNEQITAILEAFKPFAILTLEPKEMTDEEWHGLNKDQLENIADEEWRIEDAKERGVYIDEDDILEDDDE